MNISPARLKAEFNAAEIGTAQALAKAVHATGTEPSKDSLGVVHDRDTVAFFGNPLWHASISTEGGRHAPLRREWLSDKQVTLTANHDFDGRVALWYPLRRDFSGCNIQGATVTNDFILIPALKLTAGESITVELK